VHHRKAETDGLYVQRRGRRGLLQTEAKHKAATINTAEYMKTKYKEDQFSDIIKCHESNQPNMNLTIKMATKVLKEFNRTQKAVTHHKGRHRANKSKIRL